MKMKNKKIYFDFETTSRNPLKAQILQSTFLFCVGDEILREFTSNIKVSKSFKQFDTEELQALELNKITNEYEFKEHQDKAITFKEYMDLVFRYAVGTSIEFLEEDTFISKVSLTGWNNRCFDDIILERYVPQVYKKVFNPTSRDLKQRFLMLIEYNIISFEEKLSLQSAFETFFCNSSLEFHTSSGDCYALYNLDTQIDTLMEKLKKWKLKTINKN